MYRDADDVTRLVELTIGRLAGQRRSRRSAGRRGSRSGCGACVRLNRGLGQNSFGLLSKPKVRHREPSLQPTRCLS